MGHEISIEAVWYEYRAQVKAFLHSKISDPDEIDDLLQEILIKTHGNLHSLKSEKSIKAWLFQIANHTIIDFYRKHSKAKPVSAEDLWYGEENHQIQKELSQCVGPFIKALPRETAELLTEIELSGRSQKEFAHLLGISYSTLKSRVQKGRQQLLGLFEDCCHLSLDKNGSIIDFDPKSNNCEDC
jgi:RNA polymerase sigma-70 factor (ECF subfamily)